MYVYVYINKQKRNNVLQSLAAISDSTRSLHRCTISRVLIYSCSITNSVIIGMVCLSPMLGSSPKASPAAQRQPLSLPFPGWLQDNAEPVSYLINNWNSTPLQEVLLSLAFLLPANLNPFAAGPSCPPCLVILGPQFATADSYNLNFVFHILHCHLTNLL